MDNKTIINAYKSLGRISCQKLPLPLAYKIFKLREKMKPVWDFLLEEETKLLDEYKPEIQDGGTIVFKSVSDKQTYERRINDLYSMESDMQFNQIIMPLSDDISITPDDVAALEPLITFQ